MKKLSDILYLKVTRKMVIISVVVFLLIVSAANPLVMRYMEENGGGGESPDTTFFYKADDLYDMAQSYGEDGRSAYILMRFTFDLVFPIAYLCFLAFSATMLLKNLPKDSKLRILNILPFFAAFFDFTENTLAAVFMGTYPNSSNVVAQILPYASAVKWVFVSVSFGGVVVLAAARLFIYLKRRKTA